QIGIELLDQRRRAVQERVAEAGFDEHEDDGETHPRQSDEKAAQVVRQVQPSQRCARREQHDGQNRSAGSARRTFLSDRNPDKAHMSRASTNTNAARAALMPMGMLAIALA